MIDMQNKNIVNIMMATYNGQKYLREQLDSIVLQTYEQWKLYINDDNSSDNTLSIINEYIQKFPDKIYLMKNESQRHGATENFSDLFSKVPKASYYVFCDQDDIWEIDKISIMLKKIKSEEFENSKIVPCMVYCNMRIVDQDMNVITESIQDFSGHELGKDKLLERSILNSYVPGCAMMFNDSLKSIMGDIPTEIEFHDWWVQVFSACCGKIKSCDGKALANYRQHVNNTIGLEKHSSTLVHILNNFNYTVMKKHIEVQKNNRKQAAIQAKIILEKYRNHLNYNKIMEIKDIISVLDLHSRIKSVIRGKKYSYLQDTFYQKFVYWFFIYK